MEVKILGILGLLDTAETDWKVLAISAEEAAARDIRSLEDLDTEFPGLTAAVRRFFRVYKVPFGNPENEFAFGGEFRDAEFAEDVIM